jgi:hypothetical protein
MSAVDPHDGETRALVERLARPYPGGGHVVERAALLAAGSGFADATTWIADHGGVAESRAPHVAQRGIHGQRMELTRGAASIAPLRFVLPAGTFD